MSNVKSIYRKLYKKYGDSPFSVKARDKKQQYSRFKNLIRCCDISKNDTILDLGCGTGEFYEFVKKFKISKYCGIDFLDEFIFVAKKKYKNIKKVKFKKLDFEKKQLPKNYDWIFLSGSFNDKKKNSKQIMFKTLKKMYLACKKGIVFNSLSKYVDYEDSKLFYSSPEDVLKFSTKNLSKFYVLRSDYRLKKDTIPFEYSMCIKKEI